MSNAIKNIIFIGITVCCLAPLANAQSGGAYYTVRDLESWSSLELKYKYSKKLSLYFEEQLRLKDNASIVDQYFSELGFSYKLNKHYTFGFAGRWLSNNDTKGNIQGYENHFRWNTDLSYKHKLDEFSFKYRVRYQSKNELGISSDQGDLLNNTVRFKFGADYNIKKWKLDPEFSTEIFNRLQPSDGFDKLRFTIGTSYNTKNIGEFGAFYRMEQDLIGLYPKTTNIIGLKYGYTIKRKNNEQ